MIDKLRKLNDELINKNINNEDEIKKYKLIEKILSDDECFFKIEIEYAYAILRDLGIKEDQLKNIYLELIDSKTLK